MLKPKVFRLGDLQLRIMNVLWQHREATVAQVLQHLEGGRHLAYTTVATMLRKMEARGLLAHRTEGRTFIYRPVVAAREVTRSMTNHLVERIFQGSLTDAVQHLLTTREVSREELAQLERLIAAKKKSL